MKEKRIITGDRKKEKLITMCRLERDEIAIAEPCFGQGTLLSTRNVPADNMTHGIVSFWF